MCCGVALLALWQISESTQSENFEHNILGLAKVCKNKYSPWAESSFIIPPITNGNLPSIDYLILRDNDFDTPGVCLVLHYITLQVVVLTGLFDLTGQWIQKSKHQVHAWLQVVVYGSSCPKMALSCVRDAQTGKTQLSVPTGQVQASHVMWDAHVHTIV